MCVQRFDDSRNSAIHTTYRSLIRSSSLREPSDPLSKVVFNLINTTYIQVAIDWLYQEYIQNSLYSPRTRQHSHPQSGLSQKVIILDLYLKKKETQKNEFFAGRIERSVFQGGGYLCWLRYASIPNQTRSNDPTAGSPTVTLLRLLLPLNDQVCPTSQELRSVAGT